jgi:hypothetical protein
LSGSRIVLENCQATAVSEATSITEFSPNSINVVEEASDPAVIVTRAGQGLSALP